MENKLPKNNKAPIKKAHYQKTGDFFVDGRGSKKLLLRLLNICRLFNERNVEYRLCGAVACYLQKGKFIRKHSDFDFAILESDFEKIKDKICDNRKNRKFLIKNHTEHGHDHEVKIKFPFTKFHVGFFPYEKTDTHIFFKQWHFDKEKKRIVESKRAELLANWQSSGRIVTINGEKIFCSTIASVINIKKYMVENDKYPREKDLFDINFFTEQKK